MSIETDTPVYKAGDAGRRGITADKVGAPGGALWRVLWHDGTETQEREGSLMVDATNAVAWAPFAAKSTISDLGTLLEVGEERMSYGTLADLDRLKDLGVEVDPDGLVDTDSAIQALYEMPLCVEATTTFEVVLGTGGPDSRLMIECDRVEMNSAAIEQGYDRWAYEIRRVFYRYSWEGSADVELTGEDRETAEAFARRVVPELAE